MQSSCPQPALDIAQRSFAVAYDAWLLEQRRFMGTSIAWLLEQGRFVAPPYNGSRLCRHPSAPSAVGSDVAFWCGGGGFANEAADGAAIFQLHPAEAKGWLDGGEK